MSYQIKPIKDDKRQGYAVIVQDGRIVNDWVYPTREEAEKKLLILKAWYG
jgi:hypothetical protein